MTLLPASFAALLATPWGSVFYDLIFTVRISLMYSVYTTKGFVLGSVESGEANRIYFIYTEDFGLVRASAQGIRLEKSKLRYGIDTSVYGLFSIVRGKEVWRIVGCERLTPVPHRIELSRALSRVLYLVKRLVHGEGSNPDLFSTLCAMIERIESQKNDDATLIELVTVLRVLRSLGYMGEIGDAPQAFFSGSLTDEMIEYAHAHRQLLMRSVNEAIDKSQL